MQFTRAGELFTVGHSNHPIERFLDLLTTHRIELLVDVRTIPRSKFNPQFAQRNLANALASATIHYKHMPTLGGMRQPNADSVNLGWKQGGFRGYADYMQTREFAQALESLQTLARHTRVAIMCAEAAPLACHRMLISDALAAREWAVKHILPTKQLLPHVLTDFAVVKHDGALIYPLRHVETRDLFAV